MPHTHQYDTRYKDSRVEEVQPNTETYETQPTHEMEVITINNIETQPEETPHVEPEAEVRVNHQPRLSEKPAQAENTDFQEAMMRVMMELKEDGKKSRAENQRNVELLNKNMEAINRKMDDGQKNIDSLREDLHKKFDDTNRSMDALNRKIDDSNRALKEELNTTLNEISRRMEEGNEKINTRVDVEICLLYTS